MSPPLASSRNVALLWIAAACLAVASVLIVNGRALFYFDTIGYVEQGKVSLVQLGLIDRDASPTGNGGAAAGSVTQGGVRTVDGSRSAFYSFLAGAFAQLGALEALLLFNATALFLTVWLAARATVRATLTSPAVVVLTCAPLIAASLGSLPFYAAYLMPDLLAPVMVLTIAAVIAFGPAMTWGELLLAFVLGSVAIVSHLSHFAIAALMLLGAIVVSPFVNLRRWWLGPIFVAALLLAAYAHQTLFRVVAEKAAHSEVVIKPFITARLIQDGPGLDYLNEHCPDPAIPTCALHAALQLSDDPYRLTASHIIFETSKRLGSFRLMTPDDQKAVADAQRAFFVDVLKERPVATVGALLKNTLIQTSMVSIDMTVPTDNMVMRNADVTGVLGGSLVHGRISASQDWIRGFDFAQSIYYVLAAAATVVLLLGPRIPWQVRGFAVSVLLGILANAVVCGGISQPATRYGARMIWLLPYVATFLILWRIMSEREVRDAQ